MKPKPKIKKSDTLPPPIPREKTTAMKDDFFVYPKDVMPELKYQLEILRPKRCSNCKNTFTAREGAYISGIGCSLMEEFARKNGYNVHDIVYKKNGKKVLYTEVDYNGTCVKWKSNKQ